ncbi:MAG: PEP-CTERM sorting domain-containing protein [Myxococcota bacterium]
MSRLIRSTLLACLAMFAFAQAASATLIVNASAPGGEVYGFNETVTIDIYISTSGPEAFALGLRAANYDPNMIANARVTIAPDSIFDFSPTVPFGGIANVACLCEQPPVPGLRPGWSLNLFQGVSLNPAPGSGPEHFQIQFEIVAEGITQFDIGAFAEYGDVYGGGDDQMFPTSVSVAIIPEPGTAVLFALGLAGLGATHRR